MNVLCDCAHPPEHHWHPHGCANHGCPCSFVPPEKLPKAPPVKGEAKCADCGAGLNAGEAKRFTVCDDCWTRAHPPTPPTSALGPCLGCAGLHGGEWKIEKGWAFCGHCGARHPASLLSGVVPPTPPTSACGLCRKPYADCQCNPATAPIKPGDRTGGR